MNKINKEKISLLVSSTVTVNTFISVFSRHVRIALLIKVKNTEFL